MRFATPSEVSVQFLKISRARVGIDRGDLASDLNAIATQISRPLPIDSSVTAGARAGS